ncbi:putative pantothenate transporter [Aaosphaeria arxii CBS 175.79]|uniref:Putative pantothenate transporter n=1 Tax=Aaosphaeria arxii CBS 175.79 TaxID=1450172 RepID=A0A6A5XB61_9PLEO|nr:putative pantothenate transporter [Aaosphaeria arxii CBS 175.79]KAF2010004.1 putative pantothenate transporter [Aaosphaeria arxii CBS 175.79]
MHNPEANHQLSQDETLKKFETENLTRLDDERAEDRQLLSHEEEKKLLRRVDLRLMVLCAVIFMIKNVDANNAANARIMNKGTPRNILTQLEMTGDEYNFVNTIYFIPFIVFEIPSNLIVKKMLPSRFQSRIMVTWGIALACHAAVTTKGGLYTARFFLGLCEAGMFPGIVLQMTYWYRADEMTWRFLIFYSFEFFANVVSALLAFGFDHMNGMKGLSGWQWFFLLEGVFTVAFGILIWFILPDFPDQAKWLTEKEKAFLKARLPANAPRSDEVNFNWKEIVETLKDQRLWLFTLMWATKTVGSSGLSFYLPEIVSTLKLTSIAQSQLLTIPSSVLPILLIAGQTFLTWKRNVPYPIIPFVYMSITLICYAVLYTYPNVGGVYAATVIAASVSLAWFSSAWPWRLQTTSKATGSAFAIAFSNSLGQIGSVVGPQIFRVKYAPRYSTSFGIAMGFTVICLVTIAYTWWVTRETERQTRYIQKQRIAAARNGGFITQDVDINADFRNRKDGAA